MTFLRVTTGTTHLQALNNIKLAQDNFVRLQNQLTTGKAVQKPSDDPVAFQQILNFDTRIEKNDQFILNNDLTVGRLETTSETLNQIQDILLEIKTIALQESSTISGSAERSSAGTTVEAFLDEVLHLANKKYLGKFIFGGVNTLSGAFANPLPFNATEDSNGFITAVTRNPRGIDDLIYREVEEGFEVAINLSGSAPFMPSGEAAAGDIFQTMIDLRDALLTNDQSAIAAEIQNIEDAIDQVTEQEVIVGTRLNQLENVRNQVTLQNISNQELRSRLEDADLSQILIEFSTAQTVLQATLQTSASLLQASLVNFI